jgi:hypothetical protein
MASGYQFHAGSHNRYYALAARGSGNGLAMADAAVWTSAFTGAAGTLDHWVERPNDGILPLDSPINLTTGANTSPGHTGRLMAYHVTPGDLTPCSANNPRIVPAAGITSGTAITKTAGTSLLLANFDIDCGSRAVTCLSVNSGALLLLGGRFTNSESGSATPIVGGWSALLFIDQCLVSGGTYGIDLKGGRISRTTAIVLGSGDRYPIAMLGNISSSDRCFELSKSRIDAYGSPKRSQSVLVGSYSPVWDNGLDTIDRCLLTNGGSVANNSNRARDWRDVVVGSQTVSVAPTTPTFGRDRQGVTLISSPLFGFAGAATLTATPDLRLSAAARLNRTCVETMIANLDTPLPTGSQRDSAATLRGYLAAIDGYVLPPELTFTVIPVASVSAERVLTTTTGTVTTATAGAATLTVEWEQFLASQWELVDGAGSPPFTGVANRSYRSKVTASKAGFSSVVAYSNPVLVPTPDQKNVAVQEGFFFSQRLRAAPQVIYEPVAELSDEILYGELTA